MERQIKRMALKWGIKWQFLRDVYFLMLNDLRFSSTRSVRGIRYKKMSDHLKKDYGVELEPHHLKYLVYIIRQRK